MAKSTKKTTKAESKEVKKVTKVASSPKPKTSSVSTAKAGKRSTKSLKEAEAKVVKEKKKLETKTIEKQKTVESKKIKVKGSKRYDQAKKLLDSTSAYSLDKAIDAVKKTSTTKFDSSIDIHINLSVDPKLSDQNVRGTVTLPNGNGKTIKVAAIFDDDSIGQKAGADIFKAEDILSDLSKDKINFDILITSPEYMPKLAKYARLLGPRGLMPNPKNGTVTKDIALSVKEAKQGKIEYRVDSYGIIHSSVGKASFDSHKTLENISELVRSIKQNKPSSTKGVFIKSVHLATTMGPSVEVDPATIN